MNACPRRASPTSLTRREHEVLTLAAHGLSNEQIGKRLYLTVDTVKTHLKRANRTVGGLNRTHTVALALTRGLITLTTEHKEH